MCNESEELKLNDGTKTVILSTKGKAKDVDRDIEQLLRYVETSTDEVADTSDSELVKMVHRKIKSVKNNKVREAEYMKLMERDERNLKEGFNQGRKEGRKEGRREGHMEGIREIARRMKLRGDSKETIAALTGLTEQEVETL